MVQTLFSRLLRPEKPTLANRQAGTLVLWIELNGGRQRQKTKSDMEDDSLFFAPDIIGMMQQFELEP